MKRAKVNNKQYAIFKPEFDKKKSLCALLLSCVPTPDAPKYNRLESAPLKCVFGGPELCHDGGEGV